MAKAKTNYQKPMFWYGKIENLWWHTQKCSESYLPQINNVRKKWWWISRIHQWPKNRFLYRIIIKEDYHQENTWPISVLLQTSWCFGFETERLMDDTTLWRKKHLQASFKSRTGLIESNWCIS
jgi:hypothetical protein